MWKSDVDRPGLYRNVFYTPEEVARILRVSVRTVYRMIRSADGRLRARRPGGRSVRIYGADLAKLLDISLEDVPARRGPVPNEVEEGDG